MNILRGFDIDTQQATDRGSTAASSLQARGGESPVTVRRYPAGGWTVVEVAGELDLQARPLVADALGGDATHVVLDLHGVTFMDARGLGLMVDLQRRALEAGGCVRLAAVSSRVWRVLTLTGCDRAFETFDSVPPAVSSPVDGCPLPSP